MHYLYDWIHWAIQVGFQYTGNYGLSIILTTLSIRILLFPLQMWQQKSARDSGDLQAKAQEIQARYQGEEAQRRLAELYARSGGKLLAGCLPALAQWPVLLSMYGALTSYPYILPAGFLWLENLAMPDPYFVLPLLVVLTSAWQAWAMAPKGQRLTMVLIPVMIGIFTVKASAAVALYWTASNLLGILQYYLLPRRPAVA